MAFCSSRNRHARNCRCFRSGPWLCIGCVAYFLFQSALAVHVLTAQASRVIAKEVDDAAACSVFEPTDQSFCRASRKGDRTLRRLRLEVVTATADSVRSVFLSFIRSFVLCRFCAFLCDFCCFGVISHAFCVVLFLMQR